MRPWWMKQSAKIRNKPIRTGISIQDMKRPSMETDTFEVSKSIRNRTSRISVSTCGTPCFYWNSIFYSKHNHCRGWIPSGSSV